MRDPFFPERVEQQMEALPSPESLQLRALPFFLFFQPDPLEGSGRVGKINESAPPRPSLVLNEELFSSSESLVQSKDVAGVLGRSEILFLKNETSRPRHRIFPKLRPINNIDVREHRCCCGSSWCLFGGGAGKLNFVRK